MITLLILTLTPFGCENDEKPYAPDNCNRTKPRSGFLRVMLTINPMNRRVPLTIFDGAYEMGVVVLRDTVEIEEASYELPVSKEYSVLARYISGPDTILALDSETLAVISDEYRDATCYYVRRAEADVRLRE